MPRILDYGELEERDYIELGFKSGLEIHQQLKTQKKLFCRCPAGEYFEDYDAEVLRHMRPTLSELGEYDGTALMEFKTRKEIIYQLNKRNVCTYEMDDTPPFELNDEALDIALEMTLLLNCNIVGELHIARKQYLDGSIPAGFQRTTILGTDGWIPYKDRRIGIRQLGLEEDACREVSDRGHRRVYKTDRLSIPLIETVTYPDMRAPWEVAEVAELLRELARSTGKVRTGIGRARQDVNVSVEGGTRVEIKGVHRIPYIPRLTHFEALRQANLLELRSELQGRGITKETLESAVVEVTGVLRNTAFSPIRRALERDWRVTAVRLGEFKELLGFPLQPGRDFASEMSDRVRVIACLDELPNIVHSGMMDNPITPTEWRKISAALRAKKSDAIVLVWGDAKDSETAAGEIVIRAREAADGIPNETRQAFPTGINGFERILPGPDRMYPDTDMPPVAVSETRIERAKERLPMPPWDRRSYFRKLGLPPEIIEDLVTDENVPLFKRAVESLALDPVLAAVLLSQVLKSLKRKGFPVSTLGDEEILDLLALYGRGKFAREAFPDILKRMSMERRPPGEILAELNLVPLREEDVREIVRIVEGVERNLDPQDPGKKFRYLMGVLMAELRGRFPGTKVASFLRKTLGRGAGLL
ncbi:MAG: Glu-tRNA(Gln) amidotransferase subunit GatE [Candidatus Aminicenantes bacterium]|nr:Glu-tRNA(Gln) amidotransferase subunit GatE [Candidatus Aminicenantes bacterium]